MRSGIGSRSSRLLIALVTLLTPFTTAAPPAQGAFAFHPVGAQAAGVGDLGVAHLQGAEGLFWNPSAVVFGKSRTLFSAIDRPFELKALQSQAIAASLRRGRHGLGLTCEVFGFDLYRERVLGAVYGVRLSQRAGVGVAVRALAVTVRGRQSRQWMVLDLGTRVSLHDSVWWAITARNVSGVRAGILGQGGEMGLAIDLGQGADLLVSVQKEAGVPTGFALGIENAAAPGLVLRLGIGSQPERLTAGLGLSRGWLALDYGGNWHSVLGLSHRLSLRVEK
jgi:hypothetical protein